MESYALTHQGNNVYPESHTAVGSRLYLGLFIFTFGKKSPTFSSTAPTPRLHHGRYGCMYSGGTHMGTSGVGIGWAAANVRDLENGCFQNPASLTSQQQQQQQQQQQAASSSSKGPHFC